MLRSLLEQKEALLLWAIQYESHLGRYRLVSILGLTDGVTRGLLTKLTKKGYIKPYKYVGCSLTTKGKRRLEKLLAKLKIRQIREIDAGGLSLGSKSVVAHIRGTAWNIHSGIEQRDAAIKAGALGAITVIFRCDRFLLPPENFDLSKKNADLTEQLRHELRPSEGDTLLICSADDRWRAIEGVLWAASTMSAGRERLLPAS